MASKTDGIDVSNHQGAIDWHAVAGAGYGFAFIKATEGDFFQDEFFGRNWQQSKAVGLLRGAYHFARPSSGTPDVEAQFFLDCVGEAGGITEGDMLVLDIEDEKYHGGGAYGNVGNWSLGFCEYVEEATGVKPIVYTGPWYVARPGVNFNAFPQLAEYPLWLASYQDDMPTAPHPWPFVSFWQFTDKGRVPGVSGDCDLNLFNGAADRIALLGKPPIKPEPPIDPPKPDPLAELAARVKAIETRLERLDTDSIFTRLAALERNSDEDLNRVADALKKASEDIRV
jgi:lysozyme